MQKKETKQIAVSHTIGNTEYDFEVQITYTIDIEEGDFMHPTFSDTIIDRVEYVGDTLAYWPMLEITRIVTNTVELASLRKCIDWEFELERNL